MTKVSANMRQRRKNLAPASQKLNSILSVGTIRTPDAIRPDEIRVWQEAGHIVWHGELADVRPAITAAHVYVLPSCETEHLVQSERRWPWAAQLLLQMHPDAARPWSMEKIDFLYLYTMFRLWQKQCNGFWTRQLWFF